MPGAPIDVRFREHSGHRRGGGVKSSPLSYAKRSCYGLHIRLGGTSWVRAGGLRGERMDNTMARPQRGIPAEPGQKPVNLALQGGGAHGVFAWGVLHNLLEDGRIDIRAPNATT